MELRPWLLYLHVASVVLWVGGMFFAYVCLRPVAAAQLHPPLRLPLWRGVFDLFLNWVWVAIALILSSGLAMMLQTGFKSAPLNWHVMFVLGLLMMLIFALVFFVPYRMLGRACDTQDWPAGAAALGQIRKLVGLNLTLGLLSIGVATLGRGM